MLDNTHTPRGSRKAITLERNFDHDPWMHNKCGLSLLTEAGKDKEKAKVLKKLKRKHRHKGSA
jgi:hypothetical protein